jgi:hypothetical protein
MNEKGFLQLRSRGRPSMFTDLQIRDIIDGHENNTAQELAQKYNCSIWAIKKIWYRRGVKGKNRRKYTIALDYFENIDTNAKAYFLGFIASDGCVQRTVRGPKVLTIKLNIKDEEILAKFLKHIGSNRPISHTRYLTQKRRIPREAAYIIITSDKICEDLAKYNIVERKTWHYKPIPLPDKLMRHFLRGYFDGDGTVYRISRANTPRPSDYRFAISLNRETANFFHRYLCIHDIKSSIVEDKSSSLFQLRILSGPSKLKLINLMYESAEGLYLTRKKALADSFIDCYRDHTERPYE